jgi:hypothetical protein
MRILFSPPDNIKNLDTFNIDRNIRSSDNHTYHCFWRGELNDKCVVSIKSCYHFNIHGTKGRKLILWYENMNHNKHVADVSNYCELRKFDFDIELQKTPFGDRKFYLNRNNAAFYSDFVRLLLLYIYGGLWFDVDTFFLHSFDPLLERFRDDVFVYAWEHQNYPNNAIIYNRVPRGDKITSVINFFIERNRGFGFLESEITYDMNVDLTVLPCALFDIGWLRDSPKTFDEFFKNTDEEVTFDNFLPKCFAFHWHNRYGVQAHPNSPFKQLERLLVEIKHVPLDV